MEGLLSLLLFAVFFYVMMRFGCGAHMVHGGHGGGHGDHAEHGGRAAKPIDPVCGMQVEPDKGYAKMYQDTLYRFCSRDCLDKFDAEPERYASNHDEQMSHGGHKP